MEQFHLLTDSAIYILTDPLYQQTWNMPGDLGYSLLSQNPDKFITQLFGILDQFDITFEKLLDAELAQAKVMAKELGTKFNVLSDNMFKKALFKRYPVSYQ